MTVHKRRESVEVYAVTFYIAEPLPLGEVRETEVYDALYALARQGGGRGFAFWVSEQESEVVRISHVATVEVDAASVDCQMAFGAELDE